MVVVVLLIVIIVLLVVIIIYVKKSQTKIVPASDDLPLTQNQEYGKPASPPPAYPCEESKAPLGQPRESLGQPSAPPPPPPATMYPPLDTIPVYNVPATSEMAPPYGPPPSQGQAGIPNISV